MVLVQNWQFYHLFFGTIREENVFYEILEGKNAFVGYKNKKFEKSKNGHFRKGVSPWFLSKTGNISTFFFQAIQARKMCFKIFQKEKAPFQAIKTRGSKSQKIDIFPKGVVHGLGPKLAILPPSFLALYARKMCFMRFQKEKAPFQAIKTRSSKGRKIDIFPKGLVYGFVPNLAVFPPFLFQALQARKMCFMIFWKEKAPFQAIKTRSSKSQKIDIFPKGGTPWSWSKIGNFCTFFFLALYARKMCFMIF